MVMDGPSATRTKIREIEKLLVEIYGGNDDESFLDTNCPTINSLLCIACKLLSENESLKTSVEQIQHISLLPPLYEYVGDSRETRKFETVKKRRKQTLKLPKGLCENCD